jgi:NAD(P)-dependent dehydrogenase (short-subunit alcohol dehydrogenase family)
MRRFEGKAILVTGGASGIGRAAAEAFAAEGGRVLVVDRDGDGAARVANGIVDAGGVAIGCAADIADFDACTRMVARAVEAFGGLDVAFNNAGIPGSLTQPVHETSLEDWRAMMAVNLDGAFHCIKAEVPAMLARGGGAIVNTASVAGLVAGPTMSSYVTAKHGVMGLTRAAALDLAPMNIRVNAICPGAIRTGMLESAFAVPEVRAQMEAAHPIGRVGTAQEAAAAVLFLASPAASFVLGVGLPVDGGVTAQ